MKIPLPLLHHTTPHCKKRRCRLCAEVRDMGFPLIGVFLWLSAIICWTHSTGSVRAAGRKVLQSGAPLSFQLRGGLPRGTRLLWEINGTAGDLRITAEAEQIPVINISPLRVEGGRRGEDGFRELEIPSSFYFGLEDAVAARNVAGVYRLMAHDLRHGTRTPPSFDDAVALHKTLSAIEESAETCKRLRVV
jgi:hypothetical protein